MTTIAYKDGILAADGRVTHNGVILKDNYNKIIKVNKKVKFINCTKDVAYLASAGDLMSNEAVLDLLTCNKDMDYIEHIDFITFIIAEGACHIMHLTEDGPMLDKCVSAEAIGSGSAFALSAMKLGLSAADAVKHAASLDIMTGGRIRKVKI